MGNVATGNRSHLFKKGQSGNPKGRPPGLRDNVLSIKMTFFECFKRLGGLEQMVAWAQKSDENYGVWLKIFVNMLPREDKLKINDGQGINIKIVLGDDEESKNIMEIHSDSRDASEILAHNSASDSVSTSD